MEAIDVGSTWTFVDEPESFEVTRIYIDEDGIAQLSIEYDRVDKSLSIDSEDLRNLVEAGDVVRTNSAHEAWQKRQ